jgi:hypothetical protein
MIAAANEFRDNLEGKNLIRCDSSRLLAFVVLVEEVKIRTESNQGDPQTSSTNRLALHSV